MAIFGAIRSNCWAAVSGRQSIETVGRVVIEVRPDSHGGPSYVVVTGADIARLRVVHPVTDTETANLMLDPRTNGCAGLDAGELELLALALRWKNDGVEQWSLCTHDGAAVRTMVMLEMEDHLVSLESLATSGGTPPKPPLARHLLEAWLQTARTRALLERMS